MNDVNTFMQVAPRSVTLRFQRVVFAVELLHCNATEREVRDRLLEHYKCSRATAYRVLDIARDVA